MNDCMWDFVWVKKVRNSKNTDDHWTMQARLQDVTNVPEEFFGISFQCGRTCKQSWNTMFLLEPPMGSPLRIGVHVFSDSVVCVGGHSASAKAAWATSSISLALIFWPHSALNHETFLRFTRLGTFVQRKWTESVQFVEPSLVEPTSVITSSGSEAMTKEWSQRSVV